MGVGAAAAVVGGFGRQDERWSWAPASSGWAGAPARVRRRQEREGVDVGEAVGRVAHAEVQVRCPCVPSVRA